MSDVFDVFQIKDKCISNHSMPCRKLIVISQHKQLFTESQLLKDKYIRISKLKMKEKVACTLWPKKWPAGSHLYNLGPYSSSIPKTIATTKKKNKGKIRKKADQKNS